MTRKSLVRLLALLCVLALFAAACGDDDDDSTAGGGGGTATTAEQAKGLLPDNGPCDTSKPKYPVGIITVFKSAVLSLVDQVTALEASVKAFNKRGGIGGHCMDLTTCDDKADPNKEADCARQFVDKGIVATLNDTTSFNPQAVKDLFEAAGLPRVGVSPAVQELNSKVTYAIGAGGVGTTFMMVPSCARNGHKKIAAIHVDTPQIGPLFAALGAMLKAYGADLVAKIPVPAGTTDFQQFTLAAEKAGATCAIVPLGENEAVQVLQAAKQLGTKMTFAASLGTFGKADVEAFGDFAKQIYFNAEIPPITGDQKKWPILKEAIADLEASGAPELKEDKIKSSPFRSWLAVYSLVKIVEDFGTPDTISREAVNSAFQKAKDVDMFGLIPPWTPSASVAGPGPFASISQPWYYVMTFENGKFQLLPDQFNVVAELGGKIDYPQPSASGGSTATTAGSTTTSG
jgi:ABC-type branched-subunit amino acid transport system substrate-binding protein